MNILVACEMSGRVRDALTAKGHTAVSCDLLDTMSPGPHHIGDVTELLSDGWDMLIAFPPCTYLCSSGLHWNKRVPERAALTEQALEFVQTLLNAPIPLVALENPIGCISSRIRKPDQVIQPWQFGHPESKQTCLWLKGLPLLKPTNILTPARYACKCGACFSSDLGKYGCPNCAGDNGPARFIWNNQTPSGQNKLGPSEKRALLRGLTYPGIAQAMADQWG